VTSVDGIADGPGKYVRDFLLPLLRQEDHVEDVSVVVEEVIVFLKLGVVGP
jgi:hypothetical protein